MGTQLSPRREIWRGLLFGQRAILVALAAELKRDFALTVPQFEALNSLRETAGHTLPATALAQRLLYSSGSASNLFSALEKRGLLHRETCSDDARVVLLALTPEGSELIHRASAAHAASIDEHFSPLIQDDEVRVLLTFANRLSDHKNAASEEASRPKA